MIDFSEEAKKKQAEADRLLDAGEEVPMSLMFGILEPATKPTVEECCRYCGADARPDVVLGGDGTYCNLCLSRGRNEET